VAYTIRRLYTGADVHLSGVLTGAVVADALRAAARDEYLGGRRYVVFDCTAVEAFALDAADLRDVADRPELYTALRPPLLGVIVVPQLEGYAHARMWQLFAESQAVASTVVRTRDEGIRWLAARGAGDPELAADDAG
jgi:hypothetical protein